MEARGKIKFDGSCMRTLADLFAEVEKHDRRVAEIWIHPENVDRFRKECAVAMTLSNRNVFWGAQLVPADILGKDELVVYSD